MTPQKLSDIFRDPFNYGVLVQTKQEVDLRQLYDFQPAVSEEDFFYIQSHSRKSYFHTKKRFGFYPLKGVISCSFCGSTMRVAPSTSSSKKKTRYLFCRCDDPICRKEKRRKKRSCRMKVVFDFIYDFLESGLNLTEADYKYYYTGLKKLTDQQLKNKRTELHRKQGILKRMNGELTRRSLAILDHEKGSTIYNANEKRIAELEPEAKELEGKVSKLKKELTEPKKVEISLEQFLNLSKNAATKVKAADAVGKDALCHLIFLNLVVGDDEVVSCELKEPFKTLLENRKPPKGGVSRGAEI